MKILPRWGAFHGTRNFQDSRKLASMNRILTETGQEALSYGRLASSARVPERMPESP